MPDLAGPFDASTFAQAQYYRDRGYLEPSGVYGQPAATAAGGDLGLTAAGFGLTLGLGRAHVRGAAYERTGTAWTDTVPANTSGLGPRNDLIVLRRSLTAKTIVPARLQGTAAATPVDPSLTLVEDGVWEMPLFRVAAPASSGTPLVVTDLRRWLNPAGGGLYPSRLAFPGIGGMSAVAGYPAPRLNATQDGRVRGSGVLLDATARAANTQVNGVLLPVEFTPHNSNVGVVVLGTTSTGVPTSYRWDVFTDGRVVTTNATPANSYYFLESLSYELEN